MKSDYINCSFSLQIKLHYWILISLLIEVFITDNAFAKSFATDMLLNPPDIFVLFLNILKSLSLRLSSNGILKSSIKYKWFCLYFISLLYNGFAFFTL